MFKLNRMVNLICVQESFIPRPLPEVSVDSETIFPNTVQAEVTFAPSIKWRLVDEYGPESFSVLPDGRLSFQAGFTDDESLFSWLLSFGDCAELVSPPALRSAFSARLQKMLHIYHKT